MSLGRHDAELDAISARYAARERRGAAGDYSWLRPSVYLSAFERDGAMLRLFGELGLTRLADLTLLEVGCGAGGNLLRFLQWGFDPANLTGNELLPERLAEARRRLPAALRLVGGDAGRLDAGVYDIVFQSTVFSSILDDGLQQNIAARMWSLAAPGGGVLWYDFCYDNPRNRDVRGVPLGRIRALFPHAEPIVRRVTLAPPIARAATRLSPKCYPLLNALPALRTHVLCWIPKSRSGAGRTR